MKCPKCKYEGVPDEARFCPKCGSSVEIAARVDVDIQVGQNLGRVVGVQTEAIHGDVYGGDIYQVQVYAISGTGSPPIIKGAPPYKFLASYTARDQALFKGRDTEIGQVTRQIGEQRLLVVYGQAGVGKTSLLAAGVIPNLIQNGALVVHIQDYLQPVETIRAALAASAEQVTIALPDELTLPALVRAVEEATQGTLVLIFDQFERLFEPPTDSERRAALIEGMAESLQAVRPELLRMIIAVQEDGLGHLGELQVHLPDLLRSPIQLRPLSRRQAKIAIEAPLQELDYPVIYAANLVDEYLVPDLDKLTPQEAGRIHPPHLQIVCHWLYQAARERHPPQIDTELYVNQAKGADGIMARYMEETLRTQLADQRVLAERVLTTMASPGAGRWVPPERLPQNGSPPGQLHAVLKRLVETELLVSRPVNGHHEYAFASHSVAQEVRRLAGPQVERRYQAGDELERIWSAWLARDALATRRQLRYLAEAGEHLTPEAVKALLLLRSAVARDEPASPWLAWLRSDEGRTLIRQLEEPTADSSRLISRSDLNKAALLLGLPDQPETGKGPFGPVARSAASHPEPATRQTAALALTALEPYPQAALDRLRWALMASAKGWRHWLRKGELRGTMADADPEDEQLRLDLSWTDRMGMWLWRARRRVIRERQRVAGLTLGGAIGAGLALALMRAVIGIPTTIRAGILFGIFFFYAAILGAALTLGMALAEPLLLSRPQEIGERLVAWRGPALLAAALGMLSFGIAHIIVAVLNGLNLTQVPLLVPMGFVAGLGLSLALYAQPRRGWHVGILRWLLRLGIAALAFMLTQWVFMLADDNRSNTLAIGWAGSFYRSQFSDYVMARWPQVVDQYPRWFDYLALIDAALAGIVLTIGITAGLLLAEDWLKRWRDLINRSGD
jgi:hypothetical protein